MTKIKLSSIAAAADNNVIGKDNRLLWHIPEDFRHFKRTTMGKPLIMGRKTFESLPGGLKGRPHIIISRSAPDTPAQTPSPVSIESPLPHPDLYYVKSIEDATAIAKEIAAKDGMDEVFIIGGGEIYKQTMPLIDRLYLTRVHREYQGDTFFPEINWNDWEITYEARHEAAGQTPAFTFLTLERK